MKKIIAIGIFALLILSACSSKELVTPAQNDTITLPDGTVVNTKPVENNEKVPPRKLPEKLPEGATLLPDGTVDYGPEAQENSVSK